MAHYKALYKKKLNQIRSFQRTTISSLGQLNKGIYLAILFCVTCVALSCHEQTEAEWQHQDLTEDGVFGISTDKAYRSLTKDKKVNSVIVAILDGGIDINHEDLKPNVWINKKEIQNNGIDDDHNGYIDDVWGWNFVASSTTSIEFDNTELVRSVRRDEARFSASELADILPADSADFEIYQKNKAELNTALKEAKKNLAQVKKLQITLNHVLKEIGRQNPTLEDFRSFMPKNYQENQVRSLFNDRLKRKTFAEAYQEDILEMKEHFQNQVSYHYNLEYNPRADKSIGNKNINGPHALHGTHVAGIVAAVRDNQIGIHGVADHAQIMCLRCVPDGDERDEDVAKAIRYAADNGAKIINMSFGKYYSSNRKVVDEAIKYAEARDVLFIRAAGNESKDLDKELSFPSPEYLDGGRANAWITVGASDHENDESLRAIFSNYGKTKVDVFAPGVRLNSCIPGSKYRRLDGTSMAAPVVAGLAALILTYYPELKAVEVKNIILKTVTKADQLKDKCVAGGVVNAYSAIELAARYQLKP